MREGAGHKYKLDPKVRMIANGDETVNALRAERSPAVVVVGGPARRGLPSQRGPEARTSFRDEMPRSAKRGHLRKPTKDVYTTVFVQLKRDVTEIPEALAQHAPGISPPVRKGNVVSAAVRLDRLASLLSEPGVVAVESTERIRFTPPIEVRYPDGTSPRTLEPRRPPRAKGRGGGVLIGVVDVQGFDFAHREFLDAKGKTRFYNIWDQGGDTRPAPPPFGYGSELTQRQMNGAIEASAAQGLPATELEPQSQMVTASHGTHVASIAAGRHGVCPGAVLAGVLISLPTEDMDRRRSFYDSSRLAHAVDYLFGVGEELGLPVSINVSLGTNGHAHDASSATSRWIDHALATAGRCISVAAGNAGQEAPARPGDWGFVIGRIHSSGRLTAMEPTVDIEWVVAGDGIADLSENELEIWFSPRDRFEVEIKPPDSPWVGPIRPGEFVENIELPSSTILSVYNELYSPANGHSHIGCYLSPFYSEAGIVGIRAGTWLVRLRGVEIRDGQYHAWIERDDPRRMGNAGLLEAWAFPSFFSAQSNVDNSSVSSLACGQRVLSVANYDPVKRRIHITSSQGPTRDGRKKPDVAAPGTDILAANGFDPDRPTVAMTGTSMASPFVAGVAGLMLSAEPKLTAAQIVGIVQRTARPIAGQGSSWRDTAGFGLVDADACLAEVARLNRRKDLIPSGRM